MSAPTAADLVKFLGHDTADTALVAQASAALTTVGAMVDAYCRGKHRNTSGEPRTGVNEVILTAAARLLTNPEQLPMDIGDVSIRGGFTGFTLVELAVLNRYRKRSL